MKKLGLVGDISWISTMNYYQYTNEYTNERLGGLNFAKCIIYSLNFNDYQKNDTSKSPASSFNLIANACENLKRNGAEAIVLCANTAHMVAEKIEQKNNCL